MGTPLFFFGTLCHLPLLEQVLGRSVSVEVAHAQGMSAYWVAGQSFPTLQDGGAADGLLLRDAIAADIARLDFYEGGFGYRLVDITVETAKGPVAAQVYRSDQTFEIGAPWSLQDWIATYGELTLQAAREVMEGFGHISPETVAQRFGMIRARAGAVVNARRQPSEASASGLTAADVEVSETRWPYTHYFSLQEMTLRHRRYDGAMSAQVERAVFVATDVAIVLPYDPVRDRVLLVEQFRMGPFARGDAHPWSLEPIAGRIDTVETAEETARREAREEAGLELGALHLIASCYPSPGATTEHFTSFLGIADLPDDVTGIGGLASEQEDIRSTLVSFDSLMKMARADAVSNAPLVMAAWWLAAHRAALRV
ncbi:NUDIX domain-containing protein [Cognatishimia sp. MH4019]|uniref:NUDIX domain-containing protein n=1 Tax=Cognatishimia sp. MH4019 TaxID=2854030 RepID=UPI001CD21DF0|nr:NUDIX domain-containing protein [Cognatishimia sp. MH4019]